MDLSRALNAPFKDRDWVVKVLLGGLWGLLIVTIPAQLGAMMAYVRSVANDDESLPAWSNFGSKWVSGFLLLVGTTIYMLPAIVLSGVIMAGAAAAIASQDPYAAAAVAGTGLLLGLLSLIWMIVASLPLSAAMVNYSITGQFSSMFAIGYLIKLIRSRTGFFKAWGLSLLIGVVAGITVSALSMLLIGYILAPWLYFLSYIFSAHLFGQWARVAMGLGQASNQASPPAPPSAPFVAPQAPPPEPAPPATPAPPEEPKPPSPPQ